MNANENFLTAIKERLIFLREQKFSTPTEFGNVANVNERRNESYQSDYRITTIARSVIALDVEMGELITREMLKKYAEDLDEEERQREENERWKNRQHRVLNTVTLLEQGDLGDIRDDWFFDNSSTVSEWQMRKNS